MTSDEILRDIVCIVHMTCDLCNERVQDKDMHCKMCVRVIASSQSLCVTVLTLVHYFELTNLLLSLSGEVAVSVILAHTLLVCSMVDNCHVSRLARLGNGKRCERKNSTNSGLTWSTHSLPTIIFCIVVTTLFHV